MNLRQLCPEVIVRFCQNYMYILYSVFQGGISLVTSNSNTAKKYAIAGAQMEKQGLLDGIVIIPEKTHK